MKPLWLVGAAALATFLAVRRRRLEPTLLVGGIIVVLGSLLYGLGLVEIPDIEQLLEDLGRSLGKWTYLLVGGLAFLETGAFVGLIAPGETAIVVGGVVAGQGQIDIVTLIALVWFAAVAGDLTSFALGRFLGREFLVRHGGKVSITPERLETVEGFFEKHGGKAILLGRFVGLVRAIAPFLAGSSGMRVRRFLPYDIIGAGLWGTTFCLLGYAFWQSFGTVLEYAKTGTLALGTTIVVITGVVVTVRFLREAENRERVRAFVRAQEQRPLVGPPVRLLVRCAERPARFVFDRVTPGNLGLELTTLVAVIAVGAFVVIAYAITLGAGTTPRGDLRALEIVGDVRTGWLTDLAKVLTSLGLLSLTAVAAAVACAILVVKRERLEAAVIGGGYALMLLAEQLVRAGVDRARPAGGLVETTTASFTSAHTAHSVVWVAIAVAVARVLPGWGARTALVAGSATVVVVVALTRMELGVHYLSDVLAGAGLGAACFAAVGVAALVVAHLRHNAAEG
ncbi:MAG: VTT domain-containing protein [Solirubrobacterales bacterium]|nr:VTT domain-containing protein [Solirubrobacterales bacterium]